MSETHWETHWETRFRNACEEFQAEKAHICADYEAKIDEMKKVHAKEIAKMIERCTDKESQITELARRNNDLTMKNHCLRDENANLNYVLNDIRMANKMCVECLLEDDEPISGGYVELTNHTCYQDFIGILINNGYSVGITPLNDGRNLGITINEREVK